MEKHQVHTAERKRRVEQPNRTEKRRMTRHQTGTSQAPGSSRFCSRVATGTTAHFRLWMADLKLKSVLQKTSTAALADHLNISALCRSAFAIMFVHGIRNVFDLSQTSVERLLALPDIGPKKLQAVEKYLIANNVKPRWTVGE